MMRRVLFAVLLVLTGFSYISYADSLEDYRFFDLKTEYNSLRDTDTSPINEGFLTIRDGSIVTELSLALDPLPNKIMLINHDPEVTSGVDEDFEWIEFAMPDEHNPSRFQYEGQYDRRVSRIYYVLLYDDEETEVWFNYEKFEVGVLTEVHF